MLDKLCSEKLQKKSLRESKAIADIFYAKRNLFIFKTFLIVNHSAKDLKEILHKRITYDIVILIRHEDMCVQTKILD